MLIFFIGALCMMIVPGLVLMYRKRRISKGAVWGFSFLAYLVGYGLALLIAMGLIMNGQLGPEEATVVPGGLITVFLVNWFMRWKLREKGLLKENPSWMVDEQEEEETPAEAAVEQAVRETPLSAATDVPTVPTKETALAKVEESSLDLLAQIQEEAEAERTGKAVQEPQEATKRKGAPVWVCALLAVLCMGLGAGCGVLGYTVVNLREEQTQYSAEIDRLRSVNQVLNQRKSEAENELFDLKYSGELYFWRKHAVIVTPTGEKYHTYGCSTIANSDSFLIYNVEAADRRGYEPCSVCDPPLTMAREHERSMESARLKERLNQMRNSG